MIFAAAETGRAIHVHIRGRRGIFPVKKIISETTSAVLIHAARVIHSAAGITIADKGAVLIRETREILSAAEISREDQTGAPAKEIHAAHSAAGIITADRDAGMISGIQEALSAAAEIVSEDKAAHRTRETHATHSVDEITIAGRIAVLINEIQGVLSAAAEISLEDKAAGPAKETRAAPFGAGIISGDRIVGRAFRKGMAAAQTLHAEKETLPGPVLTDSLGAILRTDRRETTGGTDKRPHNCLISRNQEKNNFFHRRRKSRITAFAIAGFSFSSE